MDRKKPENKSEKWPKTSNEKPKESKDDWEDEKLDEEMEEIFHPTSHYFSIADLASDREVEGSPHFNEKDYELHRRGSFQYHQPLHKLYHKHRKSSHRKPTEDQPPSTMTKVPEESFEREEPSEDDPLMADATDSGVSQIGNDKKEDRVQFYCGSLTSMENATAANNSVGKVPSKSAMKELGHSDTSNSLSPSQGTHGSLRTGEAVGLSETSFNKPSNDLLQPDAKPKVKFFISGEPEESKDNLQAASSESSRASRPRNSKKHSVRRKHHGLDIDVKNYKTVLEPEEAETLQSADIDDMASHRFEDPVGMRRHKVKDVTTSLHGHKDDPIPLAMPFIKKKYIHEPHELFVELHELKEYELTDVLEWRQTARWIKYEEDVELGPDKWGKPHVPPLSFHSLLELRQCIDSGGVLFDVEEKDLAGILKRVVECMVHTDQIKPEVKDSVLRSLMLRHRHVNEKNLHVMRRNSSGYGNLTLLSHDKNRSPLFLKTVKEKPENDTNNLHADETSVPGETVILMPPNNSIMDFTKRKSMSHDKIIEPGIQRRIPENAEGAAVLVGQMEELEHPATVFVRLAESNLMPHFLEIPIKVRFLFVVLGPSQSSLDYHEIGRAIGALMSNTEFHVTAYKAVNRKDLLHALNNFLDSSIVMAPGKWEKQSLLPLDEIRRKSLLPPRKTKDKPPEEPEIPGYDPLKRTGKLFGGFIQDIRHRYPWYLSDILDGLSLQCIASVIFIYFAAVSGAVAFGGLLAEKTGDNIGVSETLIGTSVCGILFALLSGQPLIIIGTTAPLVLVDETLFQFRENFSANYLTMRAWVGIWCALIAITTVAFEGSMLVKFFSRFMQEVFATIISLIFIAESLMKLYRIFLENPLLPTYCNINETYINETSSSSKPVSVPHPNTALLSTILMIGTFYIAFFLRHFRNSKFLGRSARRALGDFGVPIGLVLMVLIDYFIPNTYTETLSVPEGLSPSTNRSWIIPLLPISVSEVAIAFVGGLLVFILLFMETQICELIISKKKLKKGSGFHLDMVIIGLMQVIGGLIGGPWQCAATVRSISHTSSLIVWSKTHAPGETPHIIEVKEQRLTNFLVSFLVGASVLMAPVLQKVPLACLFGVFLYMGISSLSGIHLYERFLLIFMPTKHHPDFNFVRKVRTSKMHLYTLIQVFCIAVLWVVKMYATVAFPFGLLSMILVHSQIKRLFTPEEAKALDEENNENRSKEDDEPDFYEQIVA